MSRSKRQRSIALVHQQPYDQDYVPEESKHKVKLADLSPITPRTINQSTLFKTYRAGHPALLVHGVAGSGKTFLAMYNAFNEILQHNITYKRVVIVRSAVPSRDIGHLPGDEKDKTEVYVQPYRDICAELFPRFAEKAYNKLKEQQLISFMVTSFVRGITMDNAIIIVDECQNMTAHELDSIMTRVGQNSKIIFCGDFRQTDLNRKHDVSGLQKFVRIVGHMPTFRQVEFGVEDIQRSPLVKEYLLARMAIEDLDMTG